MVAVGCIGNVGDDTGRTGFDSVDIIDDGDFGEEGVDGVDGEGGGDGDRPPLFDIVDYTHNEDWGGDEKKQDNEQDLISTMLNCDRESEIFLGLNSPVATSSHWASTQLWIASDRHNRPHLYVGQ